MKKLIAKGTMSAMLVCSPFLVGTAAYADTKAEVPTVTQEETKAPALVQGDFFYFVKTTVEQMRLALETNDLEQAKLLSEQAAERIEEAKVLMHEGKEQYVQETLETAVDKLEEAETLTEETEASKGEVAEVQVHLGNNVEALAKVLDKVKNPKAQAAIAKNIEKTFAKWADRIAAVQTKTEETAASTEEETESDKLVVVEDEMQSTPVESEVAETEITETEITETETTETETNVELSTEPVAVAPVPAPAAAKPVAVPVQHDDEDEDEDNNKKVQVVKKEQKQKEKKEKKEKNKNHKENHGQGKGHDKHND